MRDTKENNPTKKNGSSMNMNAIKGNNRGIMFYLKYKRFTPKYLSHQDSNRNLTVEDEVQGDTYDKENWRKKMGLPQILDIHNSHRYSHRGYKLLRLKYDNLGVQLIGTLEVCDGCEKSKEKLRAERKKIYRGVGGLRDR